MEDDPERELRSEQDFVNLLDIVGFKSRLFKVGEA